MAAAAVTDTTTHARLHGAKWVYQTHSVGGTVQPAANFPANIKDRMGFQCLGAAFNYHSPVNSGSGWVGTSLQAGNWGIGLTELKQGGWTERGSEDVQARDAETAMMTLNGNYHWSVAPFGGSWEAATDHMLLTLESTAKPKQVWTFKSAEPTMCKPVYSAEEETCGGGGGGGDGAGSPPPPSGAGGPPRGGGNAGGNEKAAADGAAGGAKGGCVVM